MKIFFLLRFNGANGEKSAWHDIDEYGFLAFWSQDSALWVKTDKTGLDFALNLTLYRWSLKYLWISPSASLIATSIQFISQKHFWRYSSSSNTKENEIWSELCCWLFTSPHLSRVMMADPTMTKTLNPQRTPTKRPTPIFPGEPLLKSEKFSVDPAELDPAAPRSRLHLDFISFNSKHNISPFLCGCFLLCKSMTFYQ